MPPAALDVSMWPWGHLAVGYLLYAAYSRLRYRIRPGEATAVAAALGTQFPDLVDKPLAWTVPILPSGRSFAHSLLTATVVIALVTWLANRRASPKVGPAFAIGYLSHLLTDGIAPFLSGDVSKLTYLGWPLLPPPDYGVEKGFIAHFARLEPSAVVSFQGILAACTVLLWVRDGAPGIRTLRLGATQVYRIVTTGR